MKTIWKYQLEIVGEQSIQLPEGAEILSAQVQCESLCLWALVTPANPIQRRIIEIIGTGHPLDESERKYISTVQADGGDLVRHIFEKS